MSLLFNIHVTMIRINYIKVSGVGPIKDLRLSFDNHFNIICGQNGVGKTTLLDCISQSFAGANSSLKKTACLEKGEWTININFDDKVSEMNFTVNQFHPAVENRNFNGYYKDSKDIIVFKTHRDISYIKIQALSPDKQKNEHSFSQETLTGSLPNELKNWFVNRYLFSAQLGSLDKGQLENYQLAKECFSILNPNIKFSKVLANSYDILLSTPLGEIYFEYLSSGYKSCLALLLGLIQEIELRYKEPSKFIRDFDGIVIIDEIDLHLHPEWQAKIYEALKYILPNAQIFTTTHSPHIIQVAYPNEVIPLVSDKEGNIRVNSVINEQYGCQGWTVEEILRDVMGMEETRTPLYIETIKNFYKAIDDGDGEKANALYRTIEMMLHPDNSLKKIFKIQLIGISAND